MSLLLWIPLLVPAGCAAAAASSRRASWTRPLGLVSALVLLVTGLGLLTAVTAAGGAAPTAAGDLLRVDALAAYLLMTIGAVATVALWADLSLPAEPDGWFTALVCAFLGAMSLAVLADNLGVLWVAIEATTITTAFLVGYRSGRRSLEAAWKYVVLGSVGVAIAFLGIVVLYAATRAAGHPTLSWVELVGLAPQLDPAVTRLGIALATLGFATKAGLAPMHSWLPDAHSQAPAPVSGLMSGVLLSVALYAVLRLRTISDLALGPGFLRGVLVVLGVLSLAAAGTLTLTQRDYKRLLAYSSIEHMGLMAVGVAIGGTLATTAVLVHMLGHGLVKSAMFVQSGRILRAEGSSRVADIVGLSARRPDLAGPLLIGTAALLGFPPFVLFFTEVAIIVAGWAAGLAPVMLLVLGLLLLTFVGMARQVLAMTLGPARVGVTADAHAAGGTAVAESAVERLPGTAQAPVTVALCAAVAAGLVALPAAGALGAAVVALGVTP